MVATVPSGARGVTGSGATPAPIRPVSATDLDRIRARRTGVASLGLALLILAATPSHAARTDVVVLRNGDHITGEVVSLDKGRLQFKTDDAGTISIEWNKIQRLQAALAFDVETRNGNHLIGSLAGGGMPGSLLIGAGTDTVRASLGSIVRITPLHRGFWERIDGSLELGFSYAQANNLTQVNMSTDATYRQREFAVKLDGNSTYVRQDGVDDTQRGALGGVYTHFLDRGLLAQVLLGAERNLTLGLDARFSGGGGVGHYLVQSNTSQIIVGTALSFNHEDFTDGTRSYNLEAVLAANVAVFVYDSPKVDIDCSVALYPSLSDWGRLRLESDVSVSRELVTDLTLGVNGVESYDNRPPEGSPMNDWNVYLSLGWSF